ncbi:polygalacturonase isoform X2 [Cajanus cajan]|uniref:polygalacturonase isoform X2 n=1 Tax=Cajanus cajan TaxID=3821 RepID=UPI00098D7DE7|nr:polygalacturonase isoform X2 [Cajanus cajan]
MDMKLNMATFVLFLLLAIFGSTQSVVIDIKKFGGAPNADITQALTKAWDEACASTTATKIVIPSGTYKMNAIQVKGPCKAPIEINVEGTIQAPPDSNAMNDAYEWIKIEHVDFLTVSGHGVFDGQGAKAWKENDCGSNKKCKKRSFNLSFNFLKHATVRDITTKDSKNFHVNVLGCTNFTFDGFHVSAPADSINTDGIHIGRSTDVKILNTNIATGDDCVSLGDGSKQITVQNVICGPGHGISVGSLGKYPEEEPVEHLLVKNCTLKNTDNGVRIKTWPSGPGTSPITDMHFEDVNMVDVMNPIIIDQEYCPWNQCDKKAPSKVKISKVTFKNIKGTSKTKEGVILMCSSGVPCDGVELSDINLTFNGAPIDAKCANVKPLITGKAPACKA